MTGNEMADEVELRADRQSSFGSPGYEDSDLTSVLTESETYYVKTFIDELSNRKSHGFEETEVRAQGLGALILNSNATVSSVQTGVFSNGTFFDLPTDHMYTLHEEATIDKNQCGTIIPLDAEVRVVSHKEAKRWRNNKYKRPFYNEYKARVWRLVYSRNDDGHLDAGTITAKRHQLVTDGTFNVTTYNLSYMQNPKGIVVDRTTPTNQRNCMLDESTHDIIVNIAVDKLLERVREQKVVNITPQSSLE